MKKLFRLFFAVAICVLASSGAFAQTTVVSEQKFDELINERLKTFDRHIRQNERQKFSAHRI